MTRGNAGKFARSSNLGNRFRQGAVALVGVGALVASLPAMAVSSVQAKGHDAPISYLHFRDAGRTSHATSAGNLIDHGGKVLSASHTYTLFWGNSSAWATDVQSGIGSLFTGFNATPFLNTSAQYMRGAGISSSFGGAKTDATSPPSRVQPSTLGTEIQKIYGTTLDPLGIYFVYTSNFPKSGSFCAWHSYASVGGQSIAVAYMPNTAGVAGCDPGNLYSVTGSEGLRSLANVTSHEFSEAITDTLPATATYGWIDSAGAENGDKCAWTFSAPVTLSNGSVWQLQQEWSNAISGCAQTT